MRRLKNEKLEYNGKRFQVYKRVYEKDGLEYIRDVAKSRPGSIILPVDENDNIIFVKQYREVLESETLELPAGLVEIGEDPKDTALRELEEETGIVASSIEHLISFYPSCGMTDEKIHIYLAKDFKNGNTHFDVDEEITGIVKIPLLECYKKQEEGYFEHASTNIAIMMYRLYKDKNNSKF